MNKELMLIQFSKYLTIGIISIIIGMIVMLIALWIYSEWLIYQQKKNKQLDKVRDKMDGIEMKRLLRQNENNDKGQLESQMDTQTSVQLPDSVSSSSKGISLKSLDGLP